MSLIWWIAGLYALFCSANFSFKVKDFQIQAKSQYLNASVSFAENKNGEVYFNFSFYLFKEFKKSNLMWSISMSKTNDFNCIDKVFERKIDACKLTEALMNSMFMNIFFKHAMNTTDTKLTCPFKAGPIAFTNFTLGLPSIVPLPNDVNICTTTIFYGMPGASKKFDHIMTAKGFLKYEGFFKT